MAALAPPTLVLSKAQARDVLDGLSAAHSVLLQGAMPRSRQGVFCSAGAVEAHVLLLRDKKDAARLLQHLAKAAPLAALAHCKRVRRDRATDHVSLLLGPVAMVPAGTPPAAFWAAHGADPAEYGDLGTARVPGFEPLTRVQFDAASLLWCAGRAVRCCAGQSRPLAGVAGGPC